MISIFVITYVKFYPTLYFFESLIREMGIRGPHIYANANSGYDDIFRTMPHRISLGHHRESKCSQGKSGTLCSLY